MKVFIKDEAVKMFLKPFTSRELKVFIKENAIKMFLIKAIHLLTPNCRMTQPMGANANQGVCIQEDLEKNKETPRTELVSTYSS